MEKKNNDVNITYILENIIKKARYNKETKRFEIKEKDYLQINLSTNQKRLLRELCQNLGIFLEYIDPTQIELPSYKDEVLFEEYNQIKRMLENNNLSEDERNKLEQNRIEIRNKIIVANMILIDEIIKRRTEWIEEANFKEDIYQIGYEILINYIDQNYLIPSEFKNDISKRIMPYIDRQLFLQYGVIKTSEKSLKVGKRKLEQLKCIIVPDISIEEVIKSLKENNNDELSPLYDDTFEDIMIDSIAKKEVISKIVATLPKEEQEILNLYFGFGTGISYSIIEIANMYNVTKSRIFAIITKSLENIKNSIRIIYLSELYGINTSYQFEEELNIKLEIFLLNIIPEELLNKIIEYLNEQEQEILFLYLENPEYTKTKLSKIMKMSQGSITKIKNKILSAVRFIIIEYLKEKYNKEITYEEYLDYLMKIYLNIKDTDIIKRLSLRTKRKD